MILTFSQPYLDSTSLNATIVPPPWPFEVSIAGHNYLIDTSFEPYRRDAFRHRSVPPQRESINLDNIAGEGTINTAGLWRRGQEDFSLGAGQLYLDRKGGDASRFYRSMGVDPFYPYQLSLLQATKPVYSIPANEDLIRAIAVSNYVYILRATTVAWTTNWIDFTYVTGLPEDGSLTGICTDGSNVYISAVNGNGIYQTTSGAATATHMVTTISFNSIGYVNDRLMAGSGPNLYNITHGAQQVSLEVPLTASTQVTSIQVTNLPQAVTTGDTIKVGTDTFVATDDSAIGDVYIYGTYTPTASWVAGTIVTDEAWSNNEDLIFEHNNPNWNWTCYAGGSQQIYIGGLSSEGGYEESVNGGASGVYRTSLDSDGTYLQAPVIALPLEGGEYCTCLSAYLNFIFVGTNYGLRMCETLNANDPTGNSGDLRAGALIPNILQPVTVPVTGIVGNGRFVYFTWSNYDVFNTGLGRMDMTQFIDALAPAYASDLMCLGSGTIYLDWDPINNGPLMAIQGGTGNNLGSICVIDNDNVVSSGYVESGGIEFDIPDDKVAMVLDTTVQAPMGGSIFGYVATDQPMGANFGEVGVSYQPRSQSGWGLNNLRGRTFQVKIQLNSDGGNDSPVLTRWTLKAFPGVSTGILISAVLYLADRTVEKGLVQPCDPYAEYAYLENLRQLQQVVTYVEGPFVRQGVIQQLDWLPNLERNGGARRGFVANLIVYIQTLVDT